MTKRSQASWQRLTDSIRFCEGLLSVSFFLGFLEVTDQALRPEAIAESSDQILQHVEHGFNPHSRANITEEPQWAPGSNRCTSKRWVPGW